MDGQGVVLFGDVVGSRKDAARAARWLADLSIDLDAAYGALRLADFEFTQGDEIQGLLTPGADPLRAILLSTLHPHGVGTGVPRMRWVVVLGHVDKGQGPTTHRSGEAFVAARALLGRARDDRDGLLCQTGDPVADAYLAGTAPLMAAIIDRMTDRQRQIARLAIIDDLRQSEIAERLDVARPTVSVSFARGEIRNLARLVTSVRAIWADGVARVLSQPAAPDGSAT
jgi:predicted XRE-type DNA-binding protein